MSLRIANSVDELNFYLEQVISEAAFHLEKVSLIEQKDWDIKDGVLSHKSGGFFHVAGLINDNTREEKLVLYQPQSAFNGLLLCEKRGDVYVMLQARIEPGNSGIGQFGPTIQSTPANYMKLHGGKETPYLDLFFDCKPTETKVIGSNTQYDLGKRYYQKYKTLSFVQVPRLIDTHDNMIWVKLNTIVEVLSNDNYLNTDLRSMLSVFDWNQFLGENIVNDQISFIPSFGYDEFSTVNWRMCRLNELSNWLVAEQGIIDLSGKGVSVEMYKVSCTSREVRSWYQPLFDSKGKGLVVFYVRKKGDNIEVLVSQTQEFGISGGFSVSPSILLYSEEVGLLKELYGELIVSITLSEEGGRFYKDENSYQIRMISDEMIIEGNQRWVTIGTLKQILKSSNVASIQLRVISSLLMKELNPVLN